MEEPPTKRQRRTDSSAMWERNEKPRSNGAARPDEREQPSRREPRQDPTVKSEPRPESHPRERQGSRKDKTVERQQDRDGRLERDQHRSRREDTRSERRRSRSRSPVRNGLERRSGVRERPTPRGTRSARSRELPLDDHDRSDRLSAPSKPPARTEKPQLTSTDQEAPNGKMDVDATPMSSDEEFEARMLKVMGFRSFRTTKNTKVPGNDKLYAVRKEKKTEYRQYMNRVGGFNRPLSPS